MISQAFRTRVIGIGGCLRSEQRAGTPRGVRYAKAMAQGELLPDAVVLQLLRERLRRDDDLAQNGWLLDGFPRNGKQAQAILSTEWQLRPDALVLLESRNC